MDVTTDNFDELLPAIRRSIAECDLIAFDTEFSGLGRRSNQLDYYDTPSVAYAKIRENVGDFMLMQFGMCMFKYDEATKTYKYDAYNVYVFPRLPPTLQAIRDTPSNRRTYDVQPESFMLLRDHNFDYNTWIGKGVGYMHTGDAAEMREKIVKTHEYHANMDAEPRNTKAPRIPNHLKPRIQKAMEEITTYLAPTTDHSEPLILLNYSGFERKLIYGMIESEKTGKERVYTKRRKGDQAMMIYYCHNEDEHAAYRQAALQEKLDEITAARGFAHVIDAIAESSKPMIGHNMILDVLYTCKAFVGDLPYEWSNVQKMIRKTMPQIYDTKVLATMHQLRTLVGANPSLGSLTSRIGQHPFVQFEFVPSTSETGYARPHNEQQMDGSTTDTRMHSAGYDAFLTGKLFIAMSNQAANMKVPERKSLAVHWPSVEECANKMALGKVSDMNSLDIASTDIPDRSHIFHLTMGSDKWKQPDIVNMFSVYGAVNIQWIDGCHAWVTLIKRNNAQQVCSSFCTGTTHGIGDRSFTLTPEVVHRKTTTALFVKKDAQENGCQPCNNGQMTTSDGSSQAKKQKPSPIPMEQ